MNPNMRVEKPELVQALAVVLADTVNLYFKSHGHHWNVTGPDFSQFHDFFEDIYSDAFAQFDPIAENMRKLGANAPFRLNDFLDLTSVQDADCANNAMLMIEDIYEANNIVIKSINAGFKLASDLDEQGIADYLAGRDDIHKKWRWQLQAYMTPEHSAPVMPAPAPVAEQLIEDANGCPLCTAGVGCACPGCEGGECVCLEECSCQFCHVIMAAASKPAPKKDRIFGSKKNPKGSAAGGKKITFSDKVESALRNKVEEHNKDAKPGRKATLPMLKAVYRRGSGAFSSSHRPGKTRDQWAMARVNAFLKLLKSGSPANPNYKQDNDLLPKGHPKSSRAEASLLNHEILQIALKSAEEYGSPEHAIFSMAEYTGLGYEVIPALRGAWLRGVRDGDIPFQRAYELATKLYDSKDSDLLPKKPRKTTGE